jgi:hypothetical protein
VSQNTTAFFHPINYINELFFNEIEHFEQPLQSVDQNDTLSRQSQPVKVTKKAKSENHKMHRRSGIRVKLIYMNASIEKLIKQISALPENEQIELAEMIADELSWKESFKKSQKQLEILANKANQEFLNGETEAI